MIALQHRPELLILDEPTSGLDPLVQQTFFELLREAVGDGRTVFLSSHILSEVEKSCDRVAIIRDGRLAKVDRVEALRDLAHHQVELRFVGDVPTAEFAAIPGVSDVTADDHVLRLRVSGPITPVVQAAARYELLDFVSREPSLEETFLAQYGRGAGAGDPAGTAVVTPRPACRGAAALPPDPAPSPPLRLRQHLRQDDPRLAPRLHHRRGPARRDGARHGRRRLEHLPDAGVAPGGGQAHREHPRVDGQPVREAREQLGTLGGYMTWKYGAIFALGTALWSILALSSTLAGEAGRGSLDFVAVAPFGKRRVALEKLAAHLTMLGLAMAILAVATTVSSTLFGDAALGDQIPPLSSLGFALWVGFIALFFGGVAFALAPLLGRAGAAGVAGLAMMVLWVANGLDVARTRRGPEPVPLDGRPHRSRRRVRLGGPGARGRRRRGPPRDRGRAVHAP